ncbi:MAG TPA: GYD domain-containing protein [Stellaceae bacterium]|nr:GYD domain-containing protein [Stellaceae bacterium]
MPKYLIQASYTAEGLRGLQKDKASGRRQAVLNALEPLRGKLESFNYAFGGDDVVAVIDLPDNVNAAAMSLAIAASGLVRLKTTPLLTVEEVDQALAKSVNYRAPGK